MASPSEHSPATGNRKHPIAFDEQPADIAFDSFIHSFILILLLGELDFRSQ